MCVYNIDLFDGETTASSEGDSDSWIEMSTGDVTKRVNENHDGESPNGGDSWKSHDFVVLIVYSHRCTTGEYQKVRSQNLRHQLKKNRAI